MPPHSVQDLSSPPGFAVSLATARPSLTPRWNPASRSRAAAADRFGTTGCVLGMAPGTRFAFGSRLGSPADVEAPEIGASTVSAARQPSSAGEDQPRLAVAVTPDEPGTSRLSLNQLASTALKMGSLRVSADGTMTSPPAELVSGFRGAASSDGVEVSCDVPVLPNAGEPRPDGPTVASGSTCETGRAPSAHPAGLGRWPASASSRRPSCAPRASSRGAVSSADRAMAVLRSKVSRPRSPPASCAPRLGAPLRESLSLDGTAAP